MVERVHGYSEETEDSEERTVVWCAVSSGVLLWCAVLCGLLCGVRCVVRFALEYRIFTMGLLLGRPRLQHTALSRSAPPSTTPAAVPVITLRCRDGSSTVVLPVCGALT